MTSNESGTVEEALDTLVAAGRRESFMCETEVQRIARAAANATVGKATSHEHLEHLEHVDELEHLEHLDEVGPPPTLITASHATNKPPAKALYSLTATAAAIIILVLAVGVLSRAGQQAPTDIAGQPGSHSETGAAQSDIEVTTPEDSDGNDGDNGNDAETPLVVGATPTTNQGVASTAGSSSVESDASSSITVAQVAADDPSDKAETSNHDDTYAKRGPGSTTSSDESGDVARSAPGNQRTSTSDRTAHTTPTTEATSVNPTSTPTVSGDDTGTATTQSPTTSTPAVADHGMEINVGTAGSVVFTMQDRLPVILGVTERTGWNHSIDRPSPGEVVVRFSDGRAIAALSIQSSERGFYLHSTPNGRYDTGPISTRTITYHSAATVVARYNADGLLSLEVTTHEGWTSEVSIPDPSHLEVVVTGASSVSVSGDRTGVSMGPHRLTTRLAGRGGSATPSDGGISSDQNISDEDGVDIEALDD